MTAALPQRLGLTPNALGCLYMTIGSLGYVVNDGLIRAATDEGLAVYQALFLRAVGMTVFFAAVGAARGERLRVTDLQRPLLIRVAAELVSTALFFAALIRLDFANAQTILLVVPFAVTLAAAVFLGESVSNRLYLTVAVGFVGVLVVVRPATDGFSAWSVVVLASAVGLVVREFATRRVDSRTTALPIALLTALGLAVEMGVLSAITGWGRPSARAALLVALACGSLIVGYLFTIQTVRVGDLSVSAPFRYTTLVGAVIIGYLFFGEIPDAFTIVGCSLIIVAGVYAVLLERTSMVNQR